MATIVSEPRFTRKVVVATGATSDPILINKEVQEVTVTLKPAAGASGSIEITSSSMADIKEGTATWIAWPAGVVTAVASDVAEGPINAVRGVSASGEITVEVLGNV